jgi:hypothetical protein
VFLQYASDPIVFFDTSLAFERPDWLTPQRGPDVSPRMRWIPIVTMLQVALDMAVSLGTKGHGHDYIAEHYIPAWAAVTDPEGWSGARSAALKEVFRDRPNRWDIFTPEDEAARARRLDWNTKIPMRHASDLGLSAGHSEAGANTLWYR